LMCGFAAIVLAMRIDHPPTGWTPEQCLSWAGRLIFLAMIFDVLDGSVARWAKATSRFGLEMDSLCDMVSFGVAPAVLVWAAWEHTGDAVPYRLADGYVWLFLVTYVACTALRLGRYNVEAEAGHLDVFFGIPSPAAAGCAASLMVLGAPGIARLAGSPVSESAFIWPLQFLESKAFGASLLIAMPFVMMILGMLMVSRVRYIHIGDRVLAPRRSFMHLFFFGLGLVLVVMQHQIMLVLMFNGYLVMGLLREMRFQFLRWKRGDVRDERSGGAATADGHQAPSQPIDGDQTGADREVG